MESVQYIQHRVIDGIYSASLHWRVIEGKVEVKTDNGWEPVAVKVQFVPDRRIGDSDE